MTSPLKISDLSDAVKSGLDYLCGTLGYESECVLGKGTYGSVVKVSHPAVGNLAAKIVERRMLNEMEIIIWPKLQHQNVLKLIDTIYDVHKIIIFLTDLMETNLFHRLQDKNFKADPNALDRCRTYAIQVFNGMAYLHRHKLCHLDLRAENIFLASGDDRAVVADFSGLTWAEGEKKFCPLPRSLRPPEMLTSDKKRVLALPVDLWSCGLLLTNLFLGKGFYMSTVKHSRAGHIEAVNHYKSLFQRDEYVKKFLSETYFSCTLEQNSIKDFMDVVNRFLEDNPNKRLKVQDALVHPFFVSINFARSRDSDNFDDNFDNRQIIQDLTLAIQGFNKSVPNTAGNSDMFEVTLPEKTDKKTESASATDNLTAKVKKGNRWSKYKRRFFLIKLPFQSVPHLSSIIFKKETKKKAKHSKKLKSEADDSP